MIRRRIACAGNVKREGEEERDETVNHIINESSKLAKEEYKSRHDWVEKVILWELLKRSKFDQIYKWHRHTNTHTRFITENKTHTIL